MVVKMSDKYEANKSKEKQSFILQFTGNWFIDAGILGFVNLMEEIYGWNLEDLQKKISEEPEKIYYGYFPIAFVYFNLIKQNRFKNIKHPKDAEITFYTSGKESIFDTSWNFIESNYSQNGRIPLSSSGEFYYFHNFLFFQPRWSKDKQKTAFEQVLGLEKVSEKVLLYIDKTINKFLPSKDEFSNISYTESSLDLSNLQDICSNSLIFILTFPIGFSSLENEKDKILFYSPNLEFSYKVNKKIKLMKERMREKKGNIFKIVWSAIIDSITELKSQWTLENMYVISYRIGKNQELYNVKYIGVPKLQASILLDDTIRYNLNNRIQFRSKNFENNFCWLLEEFIKGKPLYPIILNHINLVLNEETSLKVSPSVYSLIIDAKILELKSKNKGKPLFSDNFFDAYKSLVDEIKKDLTDASFSASLVKRISKDDDTKRRIARELFNALKKRNKNIFLNILLKNMNENKELCSNENFNRWIFDKIIKNDTNYEMYGLLLIMNLLRGE